MNEPLPVYVNGRFLAADAPAVSALDRGLTLADGIFETMVASGERIFRLDTHLARLANSASTLSLDLPPLDTLADALRQTFTRSGLQRAVLRLTVTRGYDPGRGVPVRTGLAPTTLVRIAPLTSPVPSERPTPVSLRTCTFPRNERSPLANAKTLAYTEMVCAWLQADQAGADDALLLNTQGNVACATTSNLFVITQGALVTPSLDQGVLPGIARGAILEMAHTLGLEPREGTVTPAGFQTAEEVFLTNVARGPVPVALIDDLPVRIGSVTDRLRRAFWEAVG